MTENKLWEGMRVLSAEEVDERLAEPGMLSGFFYLYPDGTEAQIDPLYEEIDIILFLKRGGCIGEEISDNVTKFVGEIKTGTVNELIGVLERFCGKKISLMGTSGVYVHVCGDTVILDEKNLE